MHVHKLPSGRWRVIVKHAGEQRTGSADTKAKAKAKGAELLMAMGRQPTGGTATLGELLQIHLAEQGYAATTLYDLRLIVAAVPIDVMDWQMAGIDTFRIESLYRRLRGDGWSPHRIRKLHMLLSSAWTNRAAPYNWSTRAVMRDVRPPTVEAPEVRPPSNEAVRKILEEVDGSVALFLRLAAVTGARRGELCGLQWGDIDIDRREIVIRRSVSYVPGQGPQITEGKTGRAGHRVIGVDADTIALLAVWRDAQLELAALADDEMPAPVWVFTHRAGSKPWRGDYMSREFARASRRAEVDDAHLHSLRHFMATQWLTGGEAALTVASRLGHASTTTTLRTYAHYIGAGDHSAAARHAADLLPNRADA